MKATGIVRRIDSLGRIVIPKEIRQVNHLPEGTAMEFYTDREGAVVLKKYSQLAEMESFASCYAKALASSLSRTVMLTDRDQILSVSGSLKKRLEQKNPVHELDSVFSERSCLENDKRLLSFFEPLCDSKLQILFEPILSAGDLIGSILLLDDKSHPCFTDADRKAVLCAKTFFSGQTEI